MSMQYTAEMLLCELQGRLAGEVAADEMTIYLRSIARRLPLYGDTRKALNSDRFFGRFFEFPLRILPRRTQYDLFHVTDHSYAQLVHSLPAERTGVFCHDLDAFRCLLQPHREPRRLYFKTMMAWVLRGMQRAAVVFYSTQAIRTRIEQLGIIDPKRLIHAPYGTAEEFRLEPMSGETSASVLSPLNGNPYLLHVGSSVARKRLDVLFQVFAELLRLHPELWLVQVGARLESKHHQQIKKLGIGHRVLQPAKLDRPTLAGVYRGATLALMPSSAEGFGLPVVEALACGTAVVASALPVFLEVGGEAVTFVPMDDIGWWVESVDRLLRRPDTGPSRETRLRHASQYTWKKHGRTVLDAYLKLL